MFIFFNSKTMKIILITSVLFVSLLISRSAQSNTTPKLGKDPVKKIVAAMTLEEKAVAILNVGGVIETAS